MIDEFFSTIKTTFTLIVIAIVIIIVVVAIKKGKEYFEDKERERKRDQELRDGINTIKSASKKWDRNLKINFMKYLSEEYDSLEDCRHKPIGGGYATQTVIMANVDGKIEYFSIDLAGLQELYNYIKSNINNYPSDSANTHLR